MYLQPATRPEDQLLNSGNQCKTVIGDAGSPSPGDASKPPPGDTSKPRSGDASKPRSGDASKPRSGDASKPRSGDASKPRPGDASKPPSGDASKPLCAINRAVQILTVEQKAFITEPKFSCISCKYLVTNVVT
ncbi:repellent protein 1-like [Huso huso]|uniref:Repellent protein 1-like n=1 Tax=Huso huso TaxID=61971 RepID=A0ABR1A7G6_HUSHU